MPRHLLTPLLLVGLLVLFLPAASPPAQADESVAVKAAKGEIPIVRLPTASGAHLLPSLSGGVVEAAKSALEQQHAAAAAVQPRSGALGVQDRTLGCSDRDPGGNVRVNQDCTYRRQAEESITVNPVDLRNLIAGQNDSRIGFNHCGFDYSFDSGHTWGDGLPPFWQRLNSPPDGHTILGGPGTGHTYDFASDPGVAMDSHGNAYFSCVVIDINDNASGLLVTSSPSYAGGSFYNNVPAAGPSYVVVEDNNAGASHDKPFITADSYATSPFRDTVYATWTVFEFDPRCVASFNPAGECSSPIYFSKSTDHAQTWSAPKLISGSSPTLCVGQLDPNAGANDCDIDQGSQPIVRPNGDVVVIFNNFNTPSTVNQQLAVVSKDGGNSFSAPVFVGKDDTTDEPVCDFGRGPEECIPGAYIRTNDYPRLAVNRGNGDLYAVWQDYRTGEFDIHESVSTDGGKTWKESNRPVNPDSGKDHYFAAVDIVPSAGPHTNSTNHVAVSYYRTGRVPSENAPPACPTVQGANCFAPGQPGVQQQSSDYSLAGGRGLDAPYADARVSPSFPPPDGNQAGFNGDYSGLVVVNGLAHPIWSDTRNAAPPDQSAAQGGLTHDEDVFSDQRPIPDGEGTPGNE